MFSRSRRKSRPGIVARLVRLSTSLLVLGGFILVISLFIRTLAGIDISTIGRLTAPLAEKVGVSQDAFGQVAGTFVERFSNTGLSSNNVSTGLAENTLSSSTSRSENEYVSKIYIVADSHEDNVALGKAIALAEEDDASYIFHLGDISNWGDTATLTEGRRLFDNTSVPWFVLPGDHDQGQSGDLSNFEQVFGETYALLNIGELGILVFDNSANFTPLTGEKMEWFRQNVSKADVVLLSQPIYHPITNNVFGIMGMVNGEVTTEVYAQGQQLLSYIRDSNVKLVISADRHVFSKNKDNVRRDLEHVVVGALGDEASKLGTPGYVLLGVTSENNLVVEDKKLE